MRGRGAKHGGRCRVPGAKCARQGEGEKSFRICCKVHGARVPLLRASLFAKASWNSPRRLLSKGVYSQAIE